MPLSRRVAVTSLSLVLFSSLLIAQDAGRFTSASNVRVRTEPSDSAAVVVAVPLGTPLTGIESGGGGAWLRVRTGDGKEGWVRAQFTRRFTGDTRFDVVEQIAGERLARRGDSFAAQLELVDLLERTMKETNDPERGGRLAVLWLRAVSGALGAIPGRARPADPYATWLAAHEPLAIFNSPGGQWMIRQEAVRDLHQRHRDSSSADEIAWTAVTLGVAGECEGFAPCYVQRTNTLEGEYLRRHSAGRHADEAVTRIATAAGWWMTRLSSPDSFTPAKDCSALMPSLTPLRAAVASTRTTQREEVLGLLDQTKKACDGKGDRDRR
jgi:hypothetical protein